MEDYKNIIVAVDGSESSKAALQRAIQVAQRNKAVLNIVNVIDTRVWASLEARNRDKLEADAQQFATSLVDSYDDAEKAGIEQIEIITEAGSPRTVITQEVAPRIGADLIICGATGVTATERIFLGSVSEAIVRTAPCDTLVVR
ncbi:universal stress protein UspA [Kurthia sp. 3B1D]|uniref:Universal stress protein n=1 Tax=Candidatus Kurthia intestinigallinarum TaxID=1562256 RepID=A0A433RTZ1_9BACL|nr:MULTISPECIES: universal stress protein [unclassified Kurthia]RUS55604.1 universal stress protein UspA [Kurthia sp. 3B1D]